MPAGLLDPGIPYASGECGTNTLGESGECTQFLPNFVAWVLAWSALQLLRSGATAETDSRQLSAAGHPGFSLCLWNRAFRICRVVDSPVWRV